MPNGILTDKTHIPYAALPSNWIQSVDVWTTAKLWLASKFYVEDKLNIKQGDARYWNEVTKVYENIIEETQPNYDVMHRPEIQKTTNALVRAMVMFQTQPLQNTGIFYSAAGNLLAKHNEYKNNHTKENKVKFDSARKEFGRAIAALANSMIVFSLMSIFASFALHKVKKYRDGKDGEISGEKILNSFFDSIKEQSLSIGMPIVGNIATDIADNVRYGYDLEVPITALINDTAAAVKNAIKACNDISGTEAYLSPEEKMKKVWKAAAELLKMGGQFGGIPIGNTVDIFNSARKYFLDIIEGEIFSSDIEDYKQKYVYSYSDLAGAIISGDVEKEQKVLEYFDVGDKKLKYITEEDILDLVSDMKKCGLEGSSIKSYLVILNKFLNKAKNKGIISANPMSDIYIKDTMSKKPKHSLTDEEILLFLDIVCKKRKYMLPFYVFLINTGCRVGEAISLEWKDISEDMKFCEITKTMVRYTGKKEDSSPKNTSSKRKVPLNKNIIIVLNELKSSRIENGDMIQTEKVFLSKCKKVSEESSAVIAQMKRICTIIREEYKIDFPDITPHWFRHTFASHGIANNIPMLYLQKICGWSNLSMLSKVYGHMNEEQALNVVNNIFNT